MSTQDSAWFATDRVEPLLHDLCIAAVYHTIKHPTRWRVTGSFDDLWDIKRMFSAVVDDIL